MSLVTLSEVKTYLGIPNGTTTYDDFITGQIAVYSEAVEAYCGRAFLAQAYTQTIYRDQFERKTDKVIHLATYPLNTIAFIKLDDVLVTGYRVEYDISRLTHPYGFINQGEVLTISYNAGYAYTPAPVKQVIYSLIEEKYTKKTSGVSINFGSDVQSVSIPGTISIAYDYSLQANERKTAMGMLLGNYVNVLDMYRTERAVLGKLEETKYA